MKTQYERLVQGEADSRGFILIMSYMLMLALSVFSLGLFSRGGVFLQSAERNKKKVIAFNMAEAGFDDAFWRIKNNRIANYPWASGFVPLDTGNIRGGYSVTVTDMGNNIKQILATGFSPDQNTITESRETRPVTGYVQQQAVSPFNFAVFAKSSVQVSGNAFVDSYDSSVGPYGAAVGGSINAGSKGDIGTDSVAAGTVMMSGNVKVKGGLTVGPKGDPDSVLTTSGHVTIAGDKTAATSAQKPPDPSTAISSEGNLALNGNTVYYLPAGNHRFNSLSITGNAQIVPLGPVSVYVDGEVVIAGNGIATVNNSPPKFLIYSLGDEAVKIAGNGKFFGGIYAPNSEVKNVGQGQIFGAIVAKSYHDNGNGQLHFDEAMKKVGSSGGGGLNVLSWQENNITVQATSSATNSSTKTMGG